MEINAHFVRKIKAVAHHSPDGGTHWIEFEVHERSPHHSEVIVSHITLFTEGEKAKDLADQYTAAINSVPTELDPIQPEAEAA